MHVIIPWFQWNLLVLIEFLVFHKKIYHTLFCIHILGIKAKIDIDFDNHIVTHCCYFSSQFKHFVPFCRYYVSSGNRAFPFNFRRLSFSFLQDQISSVCQKSFFFLSHSTSLLYEQSFYTCNPSIKIYLVFWITIFLLPFDTRIDNNSIDQQYSKDQR